MSSGKVKCTCGWSWNKSDSSKKDMYICHECGRDNSNNMKNGGWLDSVPQAQDGTEIDWDKVKDVNNNTAVQAAKIFDPTGISSWPDVYYAIDDYNKGEGSGLNVALNVLGALPVLGKLGKGAGFLAKSEKLAKATDKLSKLNKAVDKVEKIVPDIAKVIGNSSDVIARGSRAGKANPIAVATKSIGKLAKGVEKADNVTRKLTGKVLQKIPGTSGDIGNMIDATSSFLNVSNTASDISSTINAYNKKKLKNGGWLDNYGEEDNYNDSSVSAPEGFVGDGYSNVGRNYSPAWEGQFQKGGKLTFLQPNSDKLPEGYIIPYDTPSSERAMSIGGEDGEPAYLIPSFKYGRQLNDPIGEFKKTGEHLGGPFKTYQEADKWEKEVRHPAVEKKETIMFPQEKFATGGSIPGATGHMYARIGAPSNGKHAKKTLASAQDGAWLDNYEEGEVIKDDMGQWAHPGEITEINSNDITMEGVPYDVLGISDTGDTKLMKPGKNYKFKGKKVTEYPMAKNGLRQEQKGLQNLDQLTNFTNYNTKQPGGWLDTL